jgi:DNA-binding response OmpR family regulator
MRKTILVVDDEPGICQLVDEILSDVGYQTLHAADGLVAVELIESSSEIDLLLVDLGLPNVHGRAVVQIARTLRPQMPIIVMTGYGEYQLDNDPNIERLGKPFSATELIARIDTIFVADRNGKNPV